MYLSLLEKRRSIRSFQKKPVETDKIEALIEAALRSPSSRAFYPWEFIVVTDADLLDKLSRAKPHGAAFLKNAPLAFVICADPEKSDVWVEDASIATTLIHVAATSLDLGSCWIQMRKRPHDDTITASAYILELLHMPKHMEVLAIVAIGYPAEKKPPHKKEDLLYEKVHYNYYGSGS
jgi:nitroreductase